VHHTHVSKVSSFNVHDPFWFTSISHPRFALEQLYLQVSLTRLHGVLGTRITLSTAHSPDPRLAFKRDVKLKNSGDPNWNRHVLRSALAPFGVRNFRSFSTMQKKNPPAGSYRSRDTSPCRRRHVETFACTGQTVHLWRRIRRWSKPSDNRTTSVEIANTKPSLYRSQTNPTNCYRSLTTKDQSKLRNRHFEAFPTNEMT
jgi:hypothetical protein